MAIATVSAFANRIDGFGPHGPNPRAYIHHGHSMHHYCHGGSFWGRGGRNFLPAFAGGVVGGIIGGVVAQPTVVTTPVVSTPVVTTPVVTQPVVQQQVVVQQPVVGQSVYVSRAPQAVNIWIPGKYITTSTAYGTIQTWVPGHYETVYR